MLVSDLVDITDLEEAFASKFKSAAKTAATYGALGIAGLGGLNHYFGDDSSKSSISQSPEEAYYVNGPLIDADDEDIEAPITRDQAAAYVKSHGSASPELAAAAKSGTVPKKHKLTASEKDERLLALTMWGEARNQGISGMEAVGLVIMNRVHSGHSERFGSGVMGVVWKSKQFSCWNAGDPNRDEMRGIAHLDHDSMDWKRWEQAKKLAHAIYHGKLHDFTNNATFYHTKDVNPYWKKSVDRVAELGQHVFYALKDRLG